MNETRQIIGENNSEPPLIDINLDLVNALTQARGPFKELVELLPMSLMVHRGGRIIYVNPSWLKLVGYDHAEELIGESPLCFIHPDYKHMVSDRIARMAEGQKGAPLVEVVILRKNGESVPIEVECVSLAYQGVPAVMVMGRDISAQKKAEKALWESQKALRERETQAFLNDKLTTVGTLAAGVAHEINNPLSYVLANLHFLEEHLGIIEKKLEKTENEDLLKDIQYELSDTVKGAESIRDIVKSLKIFARGNEEEVGAVQVGEILDFALTMTAQEIKYKARVEKKYEEGLPAIFVNSGKLQQVFINLLVNAAQAIESNNTEINRVRVRTHKDGENVFIEIADTGHGIPEENLSRIFDPFFTTKPVGVGTGLGLSLCNEIVRSYGGRIEVKSEVGMGSLFTVVLPMESGKKTSAAANLPQAAASSRKRALVVEDDPGNLEVFCRMLRKQNTVLSALSGLDAMAILEQEKGRVDVIVSDLNMPDMDGMEFYHQVGARFPGLEGKIIFMTGGIFTPESGAFLQSIPNRCLEKPFDQKTLLEALEG